MFSYMYLLVIYLELPHLKRNEAVWDDLGIEPLNLRRNKRKVVWFSRLLKKGKDSLK